MGLLRVVVKVVDGELVPVDPTDPAGSRALRSLFGGDVQAAWGSTRMHEDAKARLAELDAAATSAAERAAKVRVKKVADAIAQWIESSFNRLLAHEAHVLCTRRPPSSCRCSCRVGPGWTHARASLPRAHAQHPRCARPHAQPHARRATATSTCCDARASNAARPCALRACSAGVPRRSLTSSTPPGSCR